MVEILWLVFWVFGLAFFWPSGPWSQPNTGWGWAPHGYYMLMLALTGLALFDGLGRIAIGAR